MRYDVLLSDADGTLFDFHAGEKISLVSVLNTFSLPSDKETVRLYSRINEGHWKRLEQGKTTQARLRIERFQDFLFAIGREGDASTATAMCDCFVEQLSRQRILIDGAVDFCRAVSERMPIYLVTNGLSRVQRGRFAGSALEPYLSGYVISEECGHQKPKPNMLWIAMRQAGVTSPRRAVMLGDSVTADIGAARNAGVDSVLFTNGGAAPKGHGADFVADTLGEAREWVLRE